MHIKVTPNPTIIFANYTVCSETVKDIMKYFKCQNVWQEGENHVF